jgi:hypothetical protein
LQRTDQVQFDIGKSLAQRRPLGLGFLDPVLAEDAVSGVKHRQDAIRPVTFRDGNEVSMGRGLNRRFSCGGDAVQNACEICRRVLG